MTADLARLAVAGGRLAIDTEFVSERRYQAQLCLVQIAVPDGESEQGNRTEVLDPLDDASPFDPAPIAAVLADPDVEVLVHAGRQDIAILRRTWKTEIDNVFDTQVAAGFLGMGAQEGYESLVRRVLGVSLKGGEGFTKWDKRPLTPRQIGYAADDARCLLRLAGAMQAELRDRGRLEWAREESRLLESSDDVRSPQRAFERLPKARRLDDRGRAAAYALCEWREGIARRADRPPSFILGDQPLVELARRRPKDKPGLEQIRGLAPQMVQRRGSDLIELIHRSLDSSPPSIAPGGGRREAADGALVALCQAVLRHRAQEAGVANELIATQAEVAALVARLRAGDPVTEIRVAQGWRHELVGAELEALVAGQRQVSVGQSGLIVEAV